MTDPLPSEEATLFPKTAGEKLREAREAQGLSLAEIAARTRVPVRQLEAIELGNYATLPSITYSVGFAKAYARAVGIDEVAIAREVRGASDQPNAVRRTEYEAYQIDEPSRVPTRGLAIATLLVAIVLLVGVGVFYGTNLFHGEESVLPAPAAEPSAAVATAPTATPAAAAPTGAVVLTATDEVWLKVYDKAGKTLFIGTMKAGDTYAVPGDAVGPMINVGRPDKVQVTVGGTQVAPLGDGKVAIKDVPIDAATLGARGAAQPDQGAAASPTPPAPTRAASRSTASPAAHRDRAGSASAEPPLNIAAPAPVAPEPTGPTPGATPKP